MFFTRTTRRSQKHFLISISIVAFVLLYMCKVHNIPEEETSYKDERGYKCLSRDCSTALRQDLGSVLDETLSNIRYPTLNATPHFLDNYKNPCWREHFPQKDPYLRNGIINVKRRRDLTRRWESQYKMGDVWKLRCLPYFYVAGEAKCGTSDIYHWITQHSEIEPCLMKEPQWWSKHGLDETFPVPFKDYIDLFDEAAYQIQQKQKNGYHDVITGEGSVTLLGYNDRWKSLPDNDDMKDPKYLTSHYIQATTPMVKLIVSMRDPVLRQYSSYRYLPGSGKSPEDFHKYVVEAKNLLEDCIHHNGLRSCLYNNMSINTRKKAELRVGLYYPYIRDWLEVFPRQQMYFIKFEEYAADRVSVLREVFDFLGVSPLTPELVRAIEGRSVENKGTDICDMLPVTKELLQSFYTPYNQMLADLLGDNRFLW